MRKCELSTKHQNMIDWCTLTLALTQSKYTCVRIYSSVKKDTSGIRINYSAGTQAHTMVG